MNRKNFIKRQGATCNNWTWSWSFINEEKKIIIFGVWDRNTNGNESLIFSDNWKVNDRGRKQSAYKQSREHIRLIEEEDYELQTFIMTYSDSNKDEFGIGPSKIEGFTPELSKKLLKNDNGKWYACDVEMDNQIPEEVYSPEKYVEGASKTISVNTYERSAEAREKCIAHHGYSCAACGFNFEQFYGEIGKKYIHVHHIIPLAEIRKEYVLNPIEDLVPVCANCHGVIHKKIPALTVEQIKEYLSNK